MNETVKKYHAALLTLEQINKQLEKDTPLLAKKAELEASIADYQKELATPAPAAAAN
jgi:hypothetical protein